MISLLDSALYGDLFGVDDRLAAVFADRQRLADLIEVEVALARAEAAVGVIPQAAADAIAAAASTMQVDIAAVRQSAAASGVPAIEVVRQLRVAVGPAAASAVHRGATSQDIVDTAAILAVRRATKLIEERLQDAVAALIAVADRHRTTIMAGRTHGQQASPITFGLKVANWLAPLSRHWQRLLELKPRVFVVQCGGAAGTLAALGERGPAVIEQLARELRLGAIVPWHTQRDAIVEYGSWLALVAGSLGKIGLDVTLLAQTEVEEVLEASDAARGTSSTMPHKANPIGSEMMIVAAQATAALLAALHAAAVQEHERSTHGWPLEWLVLPQMVALTYGSLGRAAIVARSLHVDSDRMRENIDHAGGVALAESMAMALAEAMPIGDAQALVRRAAIEARRTREPLASAVRRAAHEAGVGAGIDWGRVSDPAAYVGAADALIDRILDEARRTVR
jgi:3-carboxy-cis,cis-muconate cycloisomerase